MISERKGHPPLCFCFTCQHIKESRARANGTRPQANDTASRVGECRFYRIRKCKPIYVLCGECPDRKETSNG